MKFCIIKTLKEKKKEWVSITKEMNDPESQKKRRIFTSPNKEYQSVIVVVSNHCCKLETF